MTEGSKNGLRIVFMGTPEFAVPSLEILLNEGYNVVGVVTATDKWGGRGGKQLIESDIKKFASKIGLNILQPKNLKDPSFIAQLKALKADLQIVVAFRMLPEVVWNMPPLGTWNLHGSLLPKLRGAAPINWAIIRGEKETGVTTFKLKHDIDTGDVLFQEKIPIGPHETAGDLYEKLKILGSKVVLKTVKAIESGKFILQPQNAVLASNAPKLNKENCEIALGTSPDEIYNFVRGLNPYPGAWMNFFGKQLKVFNIEPEYAIHNIELGKVATDNKTYLKIAVNEGWIQLTDIQYEGKKRMNIRDFLNGVNIKPLLKSNP